MAKKILDEGICPQCGFPTDRENEICTSCEQYNEIKNPKSQSPAEDAEKIPDKITE